MNYFLVYCLGILVMFLIGVSCNDEKIKNWKKDRWHVLFAGSFLWPLFSIFWLSFYVWDLVESASLKKILFFELTKKPEPIIWRSTRNEWQENERRDRANEAAFGSEDEPIDVEAWEMGNARDMPETGVEKNPIIIIGVSGGKNRNQNDFTNTKWSVSEDLIEGGLK